MIGKVKPFRRQPCHMLGSENRGQRGSSGVLFLCHTAFFPLMMFLQINLLQAGCFNVQLEKLFQFAHGQVFIVRQVPAQDAQQ